jgi:hypothetical protein
MLYECSEITAQNGAKFTPNSTKAGKIYSPVAYRWIKVSIYSELKVSIINDAICM